MNWSYAMIFQQTIHFYSWKYAKKYPDKIKLLKNEKNITLGPTLNRCIEIAEGKYIARQDGDDVSVNYRIEKQVSFLESNNSFDLVGSNMIVFDENGEYGVRKVKEEPQGKDLMVGSVFAHATVLMKTEVMKALNGYSENSSKHQVEDYDLWFRFLKKDIEDILFKITYIK